MFLGAYAEHGVIGENTTSSPSRANRFRKIPRCFAKLDEEDATGELSGSQQDRALHLTCHSSFQQRISEELGDPRYQHPSHSYVFGKCLGQSPSTGNLDRCWAAGYGEVHPRGCSRLLVSSVYVQPCRAKKQDTFLISISLSSPRSELLHRKTHPFSRTCILSNQPLQTSRHGRKNFRRREARSRWRYTG
jgi:hypothetical protein